MRTTHRVVADDDYLKEAQRLSISQVAALRLIYQTPLIWWSCRAIFVAAIIFMIAIDYARGAILSALFLLLSFIPPRSQEKSLSKARELSPVNSEGGAGRLLAQRRRFRVSCTKRDFSGETGGRLTRDPLSAWGSPGTVSSEPFVAPG